MQVSKLVEKGIKAYNKKRYYDAEELFQRALKIKMSDEDKGIVLYNLGLCFYSQKKWDKAERLFISSMSLGYMRSGWELSLSQLNQGKIEGFKYFPYRYLYSTQKFPNLPIPRIKSLDDLNNCSKLLVLNEQGFGDEILFSRGLDLIKGRDYSYQVYPETLTLFRKWWDGNFFTERILDYDFVNYYQAWIPSGDLFSLFCLGNSSDPPLFPVTKNPNGPIGFCYSSNPKLSKAKEKSFSAEEFKNILVPTGRKLVSLQHGISTDFAINLDLPDFLTTYNNLSGLSMVITVDTAVAHLAAIAQIPTYVIFKTHLDWRWTLPLYGDHVKVVQINNFDFGNI